MKSSRFCVWLVGAALSVTLDGQLAAAADTVFSSSFTPGDWLDEFNAAVPTPWVRGFDRAEVVDDRVSAGPDHGDDGSARGTVLKVSYPANEYGIGHTGIQWRTYLGRELEVATLSYDLKFAEGFDFVRGGKLPGLVGGERRGEHHSTASGGYRPDGTDGFSLRVMWRENGTAVQYIYHPHQPTEFGESFPWHTQDGAPVRFTPGRWYRVKTECILNDIGLANGRVRSWIDGQLVLDAQGFEFRTTPALKIDSFVFATFFGGDDATWATRKPETAYFDRFVVETRAEAP